ncbi:MAG: (2Fe-2S) ferredoxin domain-containing protein [Deltaproteobacteria bacterium]|nr:(2Fe-2S) ferredoxin domain-containing protein [Deltaproteobacteria bacterium]
MAKPEKFVFVCNNSRPKGHPRGSCGALASMDTLNAFAELFQTNNLFGHNSLVQTDCMGPCILGPIVMIMPDNIWYKNVTPEVAQEIVESHLVGGTPVEKNILKDEDWG